MTSGVEGYANPSQEVRLLCPFDLFVLMVINAYDYFSCSIEYSVSFKTPIKEISDPSMAAELFRILFTDIDSLFFWQSLKDTRDHKAVLAKLLNKHDTIFLYLLGVCRMDSTQNEDWKAENGVDLFHLGSDLILKADQHGPSGL